MKKAKISQKSKSSKRSGRAGRPEIHGKRWKSVYRAFVKKKPERKKRFDTTSGIEIKPLYTAEDCDVLDYAGDLGFPGDFPFTRGVQPTMYRGRFWTMRQYAGFGSARKTNERFKYLLKEGQTGLSVAFDLPTQMGFDSDNQISVGEVGKVGVAIDSLEDMAVLFDGIPLGKVSTSMTINATAPTLLAMYIAIAKKQGLHLKDLRGTVQNDPLKEYVARGNYIYPPEASMRLVTDIFEYCGKHIPQWNTISISGYHIREAGATAAQEIAFTFANGIAYVEAALKRGLKPKDFCERLSFFFNAHNNFLEEIAKFRAARRLWARIMKEKFHIDDPDLMKMRFHTQTAGSTLTATQPENNIVRVALQALSSVLGGTQSLHTNSMDEALALPSESAARIALRTQQIIAHESGVADTIDPCAGSYLIESWTEQLEKMAQEYIRKVDAMGGAIKAIERGYMQREIHNAAYRHQKEIENSERFIVGVNIYGSDEAEKMRTLRVEKWIERDQVANVRELRKKRDSRKVTEALKSLEGAAAGDENLMPPILDAVESYATVGEISDSLRKIFGQYEEAFLS